MSNSIKTLKAVATELKIESGKMKWAASKIDAEAKSISDAIIVLSRNAMVTPEQMTQGLLDRYAKKVMIEKVLHDDDGNSFTVKVPSGEKEYRLTKEEIGLLIVNALHMPKVITALGDAHASVTEALTREGFFPKATAQQITLAAAKARGLTPESLAKTAKRFGMPEGVVPSFVTCNIPEEVVEVKTSRKGRKAA